MTAPHTTAQPTTAQPTTARSTTAALHPDTVLVHVGTCTDPATGAISTPIHLSTAFAHPGLARSTGYEYTRTANPTRDVLQEALARLEGGVAGFATSSGMAGIELAVSALATFGSRIVALEDLYGGTFRYLAGLSEQGAHRVELVSGIGGLREALATPADLVLIETPTNPMMVEVDVAECAALAHGAGALLVVDNTFFTPLVQRPLDDGADVVLHSATKYLSGHNDVLAGAVVAREQEVADRLFQRLNTTGAVLDPFDCFLLLRGLKTLALRMERHEANARQVVAALEASQYVSRILYPGRGGMISFDVAPGVDMPTVLDSVEVFTFAESLGGVESLITCPAVQTHADVPPAMRAAYGLTDTLLRLSVGIEHGQDLVDDLLGALAAAAREDAGRP